VAFTGRGFELNFESTRLADAPLTAAALSEEAVQWASVGGELKVRQ
jgi:hypothetical protein